jgi:hypothetical protein
VIPEDVCREMHPRLRVEICNWLAKVQDLHSSPEQLEQSLMTQWVHWDSQPFRDGSVCDTWTWKQAYVLWPKGQGDIVVCTMFQALQSQLKPSSREVRDHRISKSFEEKWAESMKLTRPK